MAVRFNPDLSNSPYEFSEKKDVTHIRHYTNGLVQWLMHKLGLVVDLKSFCFNRGSIARFITDRFQAPSGVSDKQFRKLVTAEIKKAISEGAIVSDETDVSTFIETIVRKVHVPIAQRQILKELGEKKDGALAKAQKAIEKAEAQQIPVDALKNTKRQLEELFNQVPTLPTLAELKSYVAKAKRLYEELEQSQKMLSQEVAAKKQDVHLKSAHEAIKLAETPQIQVALLPQENEANQKNALLKKADEIKQTSIGILQQFERLPDESAARNRLKALYACDLSQASIKDIEAWVEETVEVNRAALEDLIALNAASDAETIPTSDKPRATERALVEIEGRNRTHSPETAARFGVGFHNPDNICFMNSVLQALRASPLHINQDQIQAVTNRWLQNANNDSKLSVSSLQTALQLPKSEQIALYNKMMDMINITKDRVEGLYGLTGALNLVQDERVAFSRAVNKILKLPESSQEQIVQLLLHVFEKPSEQSTPVIHLINKILPQNQFQEADRQAVLTIIQTFLAKDSQTQERGFNYFMLLVSLGPTRAQALEEHVSKMNLSAEFKTGIMNFIKLPKEVRKIVCQNPLLQHLVTIYDRTKESQAIDYTTMHHFRQLLRLSGLDTVSESSQEDASEMCLRLLDIVGVPLTGFKTSVKYNYEFPVPSLDAQGEQALIASLSINSAPVGSSLSTLVNSNTVREEIDPQSIARTPPASMLERYGRKFTEEEIAKLNANLAEFQMTTQQLMFNRGQVPPNLLSIQIKRYEMTDSGTVKLFKDIAPSRELDVATVGSTDMTHYELESVVVHHGPSLDLGHYYSYLSRVIDGKPVWIEYNDEKVILHDSPDDIRRVELDIRYNSYLYFYKR